MTDVARSRDFYVEHLGLEVSSESLPSNCFLDCGDHFVALFRAPSAGLAHYCYSIPDYDQQDAAKRLRAAGLEPRLPRVELAPAGEGAPQARAGGVGTGGRIGQGLLEEPGRIGGSVGGGAALIMMYNRRPRPTHS